MAINFKGIIYNHSSNFPLENCKYLRKKNLDRPINHDDCFPIPPRESASQKPDILEIFPPMEQSRLGNHEEDKQLAQVCVFNQCSRASVNYSVSHFCGVDNRRRRAYLCK